MVVTMKTFLIFAKCMKVLIYFFRKTHMKTFRFRIPLTLALTLFQITSRWIKSSFRWDNMSTQLFWTKNVMQQLFCQMVYILSVYGWYMRTCVRQPETGSIPILNELHHVLDASLKPRTPSLRGSSVTHWSVECAKNGFAQDVWYHNPDTGTVSRFWAGITHTYTHTHIYIYIRIVYMWHMSSVFSHENAQRNDAEHLIYESVFKTTRSFRYQWFRVSTHQENATKHGKINFKPMNRS